MPRSKTLLASKRKKNDEFYTLYQDIADEVPHYRDQLRGKRILCPCDWDESFDEIFVYKAEAPRKTDLFGEGAVRNIDLSRSGGKGIERELGLIRCNFAKFLVAHAEDYGLRSVSVSGYNPRTGQGIPFQSIDYSQYDLIITNPPFSLFREFIDVMMKKGKEFLVIGPQNAITYKECFEYIQTNRMWIGYHQHLSGCQPPPRPADTDRRIFARAVSEILQLRCHRSGQHRLDSLRLSRNNGRTHHLFAEVQSRTVRAHRDRPVCRNE